MGTIKGQRVVRIFSLGTMYDNQSIGIVLDDDTECRMKVSELYKVINDLEFIGSKAKKYTHLQIKDSL